jgi:hypothetical protein
MPPIMTDQQRSDWTTVPVMARRLGVSEANLKRRIRDGKPLQVAPGQYVEIETEMIERPQGHEWRVRVIGALPAVSNDQERNDSESEPPPSSAQEQSRALDILDALLRGNAETMERQAERIDRYGDLLWQEAAKRAAAEERASLEQQRADRETKRADRAEADRDEARAAVSSTLAELAIIRSDREAERQKSAALAAQLAAERAEAARLKGRSLWDRLRNR